MSKQSFEDASEAAESAVEMLWAAEFYARTGDQAKALLYIKEIGTLAINHVATLDEWAVACEGVAEGQICRHCQDKVIYYATNHEAVQSLWGAIIYLGTQPNFSVRPDLCEWLGFNPSQLLTGLRRERAKLLKCDSDNETPVDWETLRAKTKRAPKQFELVSVLVEAKDWINLSELADLVWQDEAKSSGAVAQLIKRTNGTLTEIHARVKIRRDGERAIADIF